MDRLLIYLTNLSSGGAYLIIFSILVACGLGLPLPEDIPLIASGYLSWNGTMTWQMALVVTMAGVIVGDTALFFIGRKMGPAILDSGALKSMFKEKNVERARNYFAKYGDKIVFFARFVAGLRAVVFFIAGTMGMRYWRFILLDFLAALLSVPIWIGLGYAIGNFFGEEIEKGIAWIKPYKDAFTYGVLAILVLSAIHLFFKFRKAKSE